MKVLIVSHNPITDYNSMGKTFLSLFNNFSKEELCHFYIYPTIPNIRKCNSNYRITDTQVMKSIFTFSDCGRIISDEEIVATNTLYENSKPSNVYKNKNSFKELKLIARNLVWKLGNWETNKFKSWVKQEKPDVIFAAPGLSSFFYDIILKISKHYNLPIVSYICDDFYFSTKNKKNNLLECLYYNGLRKKIKKLMQASKQVITICDELKYAYEKEFSCSATTVFTGANIDVAKQITLNDNKILRYFGGLQLNRNESLAEIGKALDKFNIEEKEDYKLEIFTSETDANILSVFSNINCVKIMGFVGSDKIYNTMKESFMLIHTESFRQDDIERVRFSISTKIADSLACGVPLFAYGSSSVASMSHLIRNDCAIIATEPLELYQKLFACLSADSVCKKVAQNGIKTAMQFHTATIQSEKLKKVLSEV